MRRRPRPAAFAAAVALVAGLVVAGCSSDGSEGSASTTAAVTTTAVADGVTTTAATSGDETTTTTVAEGEDGGLCAVADEAVAAFAPSDASQAAFEAIRTAWADLAGVLPEPYAATAQEAADVYDDALPSFGDDPSTPSSGFVQAYTSGLTPLIVRTTALAGHVEDTCGVTLPGF